MVIALNDMLIIHNERNFLLTYFGIINLEDNHIRFFCQQYPAEKDFILL